MLKIIALLACIIGFVFVGPKAVAEFRRSRPRNGSQPTDKPTDPKDKQQSSTRRVA
jgi:hypothetical protein